MAGRCVMDVQQLRKRLKKRAERARVAQGEQECLICKKSRARLLSGVAQVFDLGATFSSRSPYADSRLDWAAKMLDAEALGSDWKRVGGLLWEGLDKVTDELDDETLTRILSEWLGIEGAEKDSLSPRKQERTGHRAVTAGHPG